MRMQCWLPLGAFLLAAQVAADTQQEWVFRGSSNVFTLCRTATFDSEGNVFVGGGDFAENIVDGWVMKLDRSGKLVWKTPRGTREASKAVLDSEGNLLVWSRDRTGPEADDLSKISPGGTVLGSLRYESSSSEGSFYPLDFAADAQGNIYVTGGSVGNGWQTIKYDRDWRSQWVREEDSGGFLEAPHSIATTSEGKVVVCGVRREGWELVVYNQNGVKEKAWRISAEEPLSAPQMKEDRLGNWYVGGGISGGMYVVRLGTNGEVMWRARTPESTFSHDFVGFNLDGAGKAVLWARGYRRDHNTVLAAFDSEGNELWFHSVDEGESEFPFRADWQEDGSVIALGAGGVTSGVFGAVLLRVDAGGSITDYVLDDESYPRGGATDGQGNVVWFGDGQPSTVSRYSVRPAASGPRILEAPGAIAVTESNVVRFSVSAAGAEPLRYQWRFNGEDLEGETNSVLAIEKATFDQRGLYSVKVWDKDGWIISTERQLTVNVPPAVTVGGFPSVVMVGDTVSLSAGAGRGTPPLTYEWRHDGRKLVNETNSQLFVREILPEQAGHYEVVVRNPAGSGSGSQQVFVVPPAPVAWSVSKEAAQPWAWVAELAVDREGNVFATGFDSQRESTNWNTITAMYSADGSERWIDVRPGLGRSIKVAEDGNAYVAAEQPGLVLLRKYSPTGGVLWAYSHPTADSVQEALLALSPNQGCYLVAAENISGNTTGIVVTHIDPEGAVRWRTMIPNSGLPGSRLWSMQSVGESGVALVGQVGTNAFVTLLGHDGKAQWQEETRGASSVFQHLALAPDGSMVTQGLEYVRWEPLRVLLVRYAPDGERLWSKTLQQEYWARLSGIAVDTQTNIVAAWIGANQVSVTKLNSSGAELWATRYGGYIYNGKICLDWRNNLWFGGSAFYFGNYQDYKLFKIDPQGRFMALSHHPGSELADLGVNSIVAAPDGDIHVGGGAKFNIVTYRSGERRTRLKMALDSTGPGATVLELVADTGFGYTVEASENLHDWTVWTNVVNAAGKVVVKGAATEPVRFYRAIKNQ